MTRSAGAHHGRNAKQRGYGVVFTIAPSALNRDLIWAGSDTGLIHLTRDGGKNLEGCHSAGLTAWSKISFIEASHFDPAVAYAAVDRSRLDDRDPVSLSNPRLWCYLATDYERHCGQRFSCAAFARQDTENKALLFAGTELGVYVSFDDGDHWQSLQLNLPVTSFAISRFTATILIVATHGRSFWILDNITPLRQASEARKGRCILAVSSRAGVSHR